MTCDFCGRRPRKNLYRCVASNTNGDGYDICSCYRRSCLKKMVRKAQRWHDKRGDDFMRPDWQEVLKCVGNRIIDE